MPRNTIAVPTAQPRARTLGSSAAAIVLALLLPNVGFLGVHYIARCLPVQPIRERIALAITRGDILTDTKDFVFLDSARGMEPWGDANTLRMAIYRGSSPWKDALAPRLLRAADGKERHPVAELNGAVFGTLAFNPESGYYHRYWHGNVAIAGVLLTLFDVRQARLVLMTSSYFLFMLLPLVAFARSRRLGIILGVICGFGVWFSSLPYHGQTFGYAPAFIWSQAVVLPAVWFRSRPGPEKSAIPLSLVLGAIAAFLEPMSGAFVMTGCMIFLSLYFGAPDSLHRPAAFRSAAIGLGAFLAGFLFSIAFKQTIAAVFFGWSSTFGAFFGELGWRMGLTGEKVSFVKLIQTMGSNTVLLTFGSVWLAEVLIFGSGAAFLGGALLAVRDMLRNGKTHRRFDYSAVSLCLVLMALWYVVLPSHNTIHAWITVRTLYLAFSLCWVLFWLSMRSVLARDARRDEVPSGRMVFRE